MRVAVALFSVLGMVGAVSVVGAPEGTSPHLSVENAVILNVRGLTPGTHYDVTVQVYGSEDDPAPYCLGYGGAFINSRGRLTLDYDLEDLEYAAQRDPVEVRVWLRAPGSRCDAEPAVDQDGLPLFAEYDFY